MTGHQSFMVRAELRPGAACLPSAGASTEGQKGSALGAAGKCKLHMSLTSVVQQPVAKPGKASLLQNAIDAPQHSSCYMARMT